MQAYETTLAGLGRALRRGFGLDQPPSRDDQTKALQQLKQLQTTIRAIESRVSAANSRSLTLDAQITAIERAHQAAEQLPTDLETLAESRTAVSTLLSGAKTDRDEVTRLMGVVKGASEQIQKSNAEAAAVLSRCDAAYRATTSEGLASAFAQRSRDLSTSMWVWVAGLVIALLAGAYFGTHQLHNVSAALSTPPQSGRTVDIWINLILAVISVAAPVWFAWLSTKQIGQRFRLAEDYGYKSSISKAYEGYRREAELLDPAFQARLFSSALTRLDELPLRLVEQESHGSPWHELLASDTVQKAIAIVPGFAEQVKAMADTVLKKSPPVSTTSAKPAPQAEAPQQA